MRRVALTNATSPATSWGIDPVADHPWFSRCHGSERESLLRRRPHLDSRQRPIRSARPRLRHCSSLVDLSAPVGSSAGKVPSSASRLPLCRPRSAATARTWRCQFGERIGRPSSTSGSAHRSAISICASASGNSITSPSAQRETSTPLTTSASFFVSRTSMATSERHGNLLPRQRGESGKKQHAVTVTNLHAGPHLLHCKGYADIVAEMTDSTATTKHGERR